jgi:hypothetical protein
LREAGVGPLRPSVCRLDGPEQLLLEPVGRAGGELLVRRAERGERGSDLVDCVAESVEQLLPGLAGDVAH